MKYFVAIVLIFVVIGMPAFAEKIALVDFNEILSKYSETKKVNDMLEKERTERQEKLDKLQEELRIMEEDFMKNKDKLKEKEKEKKREEFKRKLMMVQDKLNTYGMELKTLQRRYIGKLRRTIKDAIKTIARRHKFKYVFEAKAVYVGGVDITDKVIEYLNKKK